MYVHTHDLLNMNLPSTESVKFSSRYPASFVALHVIVPLSGGSVLNIFSVLDITHCSGGSVMVHLPIARLVTIILELLVNTFSFFVHLIVARGLELAVQIKVTLLKDLTI